MKLELSVNVDTVYSTSAHLIPLILFANSVQHILAFYIKTYNHL